MDSQETSNTHGAGGVIIGVGKAVQVGQASGVDVARAALDSLGAGNGGGRLFEWLDVLDGRLVRAEAEEGSGLNHVDVTVEGSWQTELEGTEDGVSRLGVVCCVATFVSKE